jgi:transcriptional regulator of acetoin/glycerol metabolism
VAGAARPACRDPRARERRLREALERTRWNKSRAARSLGLSRQGLLKKLRRYGLIEIAHGGVALDAPGSGP